MLSNVSRAQPRARLLQARQPTQHQILAPSSSTLLQSRHRAQVRGIRLGRWTPKRGADCRGDASPHPRAPRYRYIASINRTVSWDQHPHFQESKAAIKNLLNRYWDAATAPASTDQYADPAKVQSWSDELAGAGARPGQNIEDVERSAINHLFESHNNASSQSSLKPTTSATQEDHPVIDPITNRRVPVDSIHSAAAPSAAELRSYSRIPIDAKPWVQSVGAKSYADLDNYQSVAKDSLSATTVTSTATPKYDDLEKYKPTDFSDALQEPAPTPKYDDLYKYGPVMYMEGMKPREDEPKYDDLHKYKPFMWREPDGLPPLTAEEQSKQYGDLRKYGPVQWREPDGLPPLTAEEESKKYEDLHTYGPVAWNEPDGLLPPTAEELSKQYADLHLYEGPFTFNEPHGQLPPSAEELSKQYTDLHKYDGPFTFNEPHGQLPPSAEELSKNYTDLHAYKDPVTWNEPDGKMPITAEEASKQYTDLDQYSKFEFNEPDGQLFSTSEAPIRQYEGIPMYGKIPWKGANGKASLKTEEGNKQYDDLDKYGKVEFNEPDGKLPPTAEELSKNYNDLHKYGKVEWNEPNGKPAPTAEERSKQYTDLDNYGKVEWNEPNGKPSPTAEERSKKYTDLDNYGKVEWNEPNGKPALTPEERSKHYTDLHEYGKVEWNEPHGKPALTPEELSKRYGDLHRYKGSYQHNEPHGKPAELSSSSVEQEDLSRYKQSPYSVSDDKAEDLDLLRASDVRASMTSKMSAPKSYSPHAEALEKDMSEYARAWEAANKVAKATIEQAKIKSDKMEAKQPERKLTGNYVRDFPEDFKVSWSSLLGQDLVNPQANNGAVNPERPEVDIASFDESFPTLETALNRDAGSFGGNFASPKIEPALNRGSSFATVQQRLDRIRAQADPYSREPQGLELSYAEECAATKASAPSSIRTYKTVSDAAAAATSGQDTSASQNRYVETKAEKPTSEPAQKPPADTHEELGKGSPEPSHYKILAYDPTMQSVMTADTTSIVPDSAAPLTPPEVMQRLSNPIKFFPHLAPLQQQGYEIVSGSGDVLVFRKVREGRPISQAAPAEQTLEHATTYQPPRVNPIDMMGSQPVIPDSFSASPTGYASYDIQDTEPVHKPPPPFRSTVRAQDYGSASQGSSADEKTGRTKKSRGKKIILGAVWVGGISYAVGVIGEYFHTGGANGTNQPTRV